MFAPMGPFQTDGGSSGQQTLHPLLQTLLDHIRTAGVGSPINNAVLQRYEPYPVAGTPSMGPPPTGGFKTDFGTSGADPYQRPVDPPGGGFGRGTFGQITGPVAPVPAGGYPAPAYGSGPKDQLQQLQNLAQMQQMMQSGAQSGFGGTKLDLPNEPGFGHPGPHPGPHPPVHGGGNNFPPGHPHPIGPPVRPPDGGGNNFAPGHIHPVGPPVRGSVRPADALHAMGNDARGAQIWMQHHPGVLQGQGHVPAWVSHQLTSELNQADHPVSQTLNHLRMYLSGQFGSGNGNQLQQLLDQLRAHASGAPVLNTAAPLAY